ncbi:ABC transporter permease [Salibacteraceae bacterium]|nr:ABC transporter permease [Salibacteraceae bacterium]MDC1304569.1 ABC transporter permease [Salibacteraceae bacterium]
MNQIKKYPFFAFGVAVIVLVFIVAISGSFLRPDSSRYASTQHRTLSKLPPLTSITFLRVRKNIPSSDKSLKSRVRIGGVESDWAYYPYERVELREKYIQLEFKGSQREFYYADVLYALDPLTLKSISNNSSSTLNFIDIGNNSISVSHNEIQSQVEKEAFISKSFVLGTDALGRDELSRLMAGSSISLSIGFFAVIGSVLLGLIIGLFAGYFGGVVDQFLSWCINLFWSIPAILLVVAVTIALGTGATALIIGVSLVLWVEMAQVVRYTVRSIRLKDFVKALRLMGLSHLTIVFRHILPNLYGPIAVLASTSFADAVMLEAGLSFLGIGVEPPQPTWEI